MFGKNKYFFITDKCLGKFQSLGAFSLIINALIFSNEIMRPFLDFSCFWVAQMSPVGISQLSGNKMQSILMFILPSLNGKPNLY